MISLVVRWDSLNEVDDGGGDMGGGDMGGGDMGEVGLGALFVLAASSALIRMSWAICICDLASIIALAWASAAAWLAARGSIAIAYLLLRENSGRAQLWHGHSISQPVDRLRAVGHGLPHWTCTLRKHGTNAAYVERLCLRRMPRAPARATG
jgi:hypothetical protein